MNGLGLEDRLHDLHRLADEVSAPASDEALHAIGRRAGHLSRRRRARQAMGGAALALAIVAGALAAWPGDERADIEVGPYGQGDGSSEGGQGHQPQVPFDLTSFLPGWQVADIVDVPAAPWDSSSGDIEPGWQGSLQVYRRLYQLAGPMVVVEHRSASDALVGDEGTETVTVDGGQGFLRQVGDGRWSLQWQPYGTDTHASLWAVGVGREQVVELANGLQPRDDDIAYPPGPNDRFGFEATALPDDLEEDPTDPLHELMNRRQVTLARGASQIVITSDTKGELAFEHLLMERRLSDEDHGQIMIGGQPAVVLGPRGARSLLMYDPGAGMVEVRFHEVAPSAVEELIAGLEEIPDDDWRDLVTPAG